MDIKEILGSGDMEQTIKKLKEKHVKVPAWAKLQKEYYKTKHPVMTDPSYCEKKGSKEKLSRITLGWQKLATKRISALLFGIPVKRVYSADNDNQKIASQIIEDIYSRNRINAVNLERSKWLYSACETVTIWYAQEAETTYAGQRSKLKLRCRNYSPINGDELYPLFDEYDDLIALSVRYTRSEEDREFTYFDTYTEDRHLCWNETTKTLIIDEQINIGKIAGVYIHRDEPVWEDESDNVYEAEWTYSRNGNYIRKNSRPKLVTYTDNKIVADKGPKGEAVSSEVIRLGKGDKMEYVTWSGSIEATKFHIEELKHNFNSQLQLPDVSMDNMKSSPMSGESRKMLFMDSQMKVTCESGIWEEALDREFNVIRAFAKVMYPSLSQAFDELRVEHVITPYQIRDEKENVETLSTACGTIASKKTCVARLGWVDDVDEEVKLLQEDDVEDVFSPTE